MRKSVEALVIVPMLLVIAAMLVLGLCGIARAEPVQQFTFQVESPRAGDLSAYMHLRRYDTTGLVPPTPTDFSMRLPRGVEVNPAFLTSRYLCDGEALRDALDAHLSAVPFVRRLERLGAFARELRRSGRKRDLAALPNVLACARGRLGSGKGLIDAREAVAVLTDAIPFHFSIFLSRGTTSGAVAGFAVLGAADARSAMARKYPVVTGVHAAVTENLFSEPTPDGLFGLRLEINTGPINGFQLSIAEIEVTVRSLRLRKGNVPGAGSRRPLHPPPTHGRDAVRGAALPRGGALQRAARHGLRAADAALDDDGGGALSPLHGVSRSLETPEAPPLRCGGCR